MVDIKNDFTGGLDLDTSSFLLRPNTYIDALNITRDAIESGYDLIPTNIVSNRLVDYILPPGRNKVIGSFPFMLRNVIYYFVWNEYEVHSVLEYNNTTRTIVKVFQNLYDTGWEDVLVFTEHNKINSINIFPRSEGDLLFFLDSDGRPTTMDIALFKAGTYTPVTRDILDVAKCPPLSPPDCVYANDTAVGTNDLRNKLFKFKYRWVYDANEKSTPSPISAIPLPDNILDEAFANVVTNNNLITVQMNSGDKSVKAVELLMSYVNKTNSWSDFVLVDSINKEEEGILDDNTFAYSFYNNSTYPTIDVAESIQLFDYVPDIANCQEMPNGNVLVYAGITEGYDRDLEPNVEIEVLTTPAGDGSTIGSLSVVVANVNSKSFPPRYEYFLRFTGIPATGTVVTVKLRRISDSVILDVGTYTTQSGDTEYDVRVNLRNSLNFIDIVSDVDLNTDGTIDFEFRRDIYEYVTTSIEPPSVDANDNSIATWPWSTGRSLGLVYFDKKGKTNGVVYSTGIVFPEYAENVSQQVLLPYINAKIYHVPFDWAWSYQWVVTKEPTQFLFWLTIDVNTSESEYIYFDITNIRLNAEKNPTNEAVLSWTFQDGDRLRLIRRMSDDVVFDDTYDAAIEGIVVDPTVNNVPLTGTFVKIKNVSPFSSVNYSGDQFVIQLYRPGQQGATGENQTFFEFGEQYPILNPETSSRVHGGQVTDQDVINNIPAEFNFYNGDSYFRLRTVYVSEIGFGSFYVQDRNFVDFYISAVSSLDGRANVIDVNARREYFPTLIRFGQAYQPNTNINGLNRFYSENLDEYDLSFGDVMRLRVRDRYMRVFQKLKIGVVPLFSQITKNAGNEVTVVTDQLLNPIQYYVGDFGIGTSPESLASFNFADYFCDNIRGVICRVSQDGIEPISVKYKVNSFASVQLPLRTGNYKIYGAYSQKNNSYIMALTATDTEEAYTLVFNEATNTFDSFLSAKPEMMTTLGNLLIMFKDGELYTHDAATYNNFFGVQYDSTITPVFNNASIQRKTFISILEISNQVWAAPDIKTNLMSYGTTPQSSNLPAASFSQLEGQWCASFRRDSNSRGGINNGDSLKGSYIITKLKAESPTTITYLAAASIKYIDSPLNLKR
jgi:hypothetical protein